MTAVAAPGAYRVILVSASWAPRYSARLALVASGLARPVDPQRGVGPGVAAEILDQRAQLGQGRQLLAAQRADRLPGIGQPGLGQLGRPVDRGPQGFADRFPAGQLAGALQLDGQPGQRVGEHVVQLPGDPAALGQRGRGGLGLPGVSCSWASSSSGPVWLWRPRRMNRPVTASSRHNSSAVTAD